MTTGNLTIQDNDTVEQYTSVGESVFGFNFPILEADELKVSVNQQLLTYGSDYTISGLGDEGGGEVTITAGTDPGDVVTLWQDMPIERLTGFTAGAAVLLPEALNDEFAARLRVEQQLRRELRNAIRLAPDDPIAGQDMVLAAQATRLGKFLGFGATGALAYLSGTGADEGLREDLAAGNANLVASAAIAYELTAEESAEGVTLEDAQYPPGDLRRLASAALDTLSASDLSTVVANTLKTAGRVIPWDGNLTLAAITLTVGTGGHFATINEALVPLRASIRLPQLITVHLLTGFAMAEEVHLISGVDLSWVRITAADATVTIQRSAITTALGSYSALGGSISGSSTEKAAFMAVNQCALPMISALFEYDSSGSPDASRNGMLVWNQSAVRVTFGAGIKGSDAKNLYLASSNLVGEGSIWDEAGDIGVRVSNRSIAHLRSASIKGCGGVNLSCAGVSTINCQDADLTGAGSIGLQAQHCIVDAIGVDVSGATGDGITASVGAHINFTDGIAGGCGSEGINATQGSIVVANNATINNNTGAGVIAQNGATVSLSGGQAKGNGGSGDLVALSGGTIAAATTETTNGSGVPVVADTNVVAFNTVDTNVRGTIYGPATTIQTYTATNVTTDRSFDADTVLVAELADVVGTLIADLRARGVVK